MLRIFGQTRLARIGQAGQPRSQARWRGREKLHYLNPAPIHEIAERWIGKFERHRVAALAELKRGLESKPE